MAANIILPGIEMIVMALTNPAESKPELEPPKVQIFAELIAIGPE